ncbi:MAG: phosphotransferase family protein [Actinomycetota bacterium]
MADPAAAKSELAGWLASALGAGSIEGLTRLSGGASRETWRFTADGRPLVVQRQRQGDERDMLVEAAVVRAAGEAGVPVPALLHADDVGDGTTAMILEAIDGETIARKIQRDDEYAEARPRLVDDFGRALARIHRIDPSSVDGLASADPVEFYTQVLDDVGEPHPVLELARRWLIEHRPAERAPCLVHGDFRLGNVIVDGDGLAAVIDWELAHLGDPMEDLGWVCVRAWRFGQSAPVAGLGEREELFAAYEVEAGVAVDAATVRWWEILGVWKWGIMCITQMTAHRSGMVRSHELAAIGRRVCENELDLLDALEGRW